MGKMQIGRWGNSLAVRLPKELVERHGLQEGGMIDVVALDEALIQAGREERERRREEAFEEIRRQRALRPPLPADWKFDRKEANWRPAMDRW